MLKLFLKSTQGQGSEDGGSYPHFSLNDFRQQKKGESYTTILKQNKNKWKTKCGKVKSKRKDYYRLEFKLKFQRNVDNIKPIHQFKRLSEE